MPLRDPSDATIMSGPTLLANTSSQRSSSPLISPRSSSPLNTPQFSTPLNTPHLDSASELGNQGDVYEVSNNDGYYDALGLGLGEANANSEVHGTKKKKKKEKKKEVKKEEQKEEQKEENQEKKGPPYDEDVRMERAQFHFEDADWEWLEENGQMVLKSICKQLLVPYAAIISDFTKTRAHFLHQIGYGPKRAICRTDSLAADVLRLTEDPGSMIFDCRLDVGTRDNPYVVGGPKIRFFACVGLRTPCGHNWGTLEVADTLPRIQGLELEFRLTELGMLVEKCVVPEGGFPHSDRPCSPITDYFKSGYMHPDLKPLALRTPKMPQLVFENGELMLLEGSEDMKNEAKDRLNMKRFSRGSLLAQLTKSLPKEHPIGFGKVFGPMFVGPPPKESVELDAAVKKAEELAAAVKKAEEEKAAKEAEELAAKEAEELTAKEAEEEDTDAFDPDATLRPGELTMSYGDGNHTYQPEAKKRTNRAVGKLSKSATALFEPSATSRNAFNRSATEQQMSSNVAQSNTSSGPNSSALQKQPALHFPIEGFDIPNRAPGERPQPGYEFNMRRHAERFPPTHKGIADRRYRQLVQQYRTAYIAKYNLGWGWVPSTWLEKLEEQSIVNEWYEYDKMQASKSSRTGRYIAENENEPFEITGRQDTPSDHFGYDQFEGDGLRNTRSVNDMRSNAISPGPSQIHGYRSRTPSDGYGGIPEPGAYNSNISDRLPRSRTRPYFPPRTPGTFAERMGFTMNSVSELDDDPSENAQSNKMGSHPIGGRDFVDESYERKQFGGLTQAEYETKFSQPDRTRFANVEDNRMYAEQSGATIVPRAEKYKIPHPDKDDNKQPATSKPATHFESPAYKQSIPNLSAHRAATPNFPSSRPSNPNMSSSYRTPQPQYSSPTTFPPFRPPPAKMAEKEQLLAAKSDKHEEGDADEWKPHEPTSPPVTLASFPKHLFRRLVPKKTEAELLAQKEKKLQEKQEKAKKKEDADNDAWGKECFAKAEKQNNKDREYRIKMGIPPTEMDLKIAGRMARKEFPWGPNPTTGGWKFDS